jgi:hypothetical protein
MKIKNIRLNGTSYALDDQDAIQIPEGVELQDGDVLVYNESEESFECVNRNSLVDVEKGVVENSQKLVKSGDVYTAINSAINPNACNLDIDYDNVNGKFVFHVASGSPSSLNVNVSLLVLSINTHYNSQEQELAFSNIVTILHLDKNNTSVDYILDQYIDDRQFYFILINNSQNVQTCVLNRDNILVPGVNQKTNVVLTPSVDITGNPGAKISIISSVAVDTNINVNIEVIEQRNTKLVSGTLLAGTSQVIINVGSSGYDRLCNISISPVSVSSSQNYILQQNSITAPHDIGTMELIAEVYNESPAVKIKTIDDSLISGNDIDVKLILPRNGTNPLVLIRTISVGNSYVIIDYTGASFNGPIASIELGNNNKDEFYEYYISNSNIQLIVDGNGNPY